MESSQLVKNLRFLMEKRMETANAVAVSCGIKASTMMRLLDGSSAAPRNSTLQALAIHFGVAPESLLNADLSVDVAKFIENKSASEPIPLLNEENIFKIYHWNGTDTIGAKGKFFRPLTGHRNWIPAPPIQEIIDLIRENENPDVSPVFALKITGNAMAPTFCDGDLVYVRHTPTSISGDSDEFSIPDDVQDGDMVLAYCFFQSSDESRPHGHMVVREFCRDDITGHHFLIATNPKWSGRPAVDCSRVIGKVVGRYTQF